MLDAIAAMAGPTPPSSPRSRMVAGIWWSARRWVVRGGSAPFGSAGGEGRCLGGSRGGGEGGGGEQALALGMTGGRTWRGFTRMVQDAIIWKIPIPTETIFLGVNQVTPTISQNV
jgi:hypothetical protein